MKIASVTIGGNQNGSDVSIFTSPGFRMKKCNDIGLDWKSSDIRDAMLINNPYMLRYGSYEEAMPMDGAPYVGQGYNVYEREFLRPMYLDYVGSLTGFTYDYGYRYVNNWKVFSNFEDLKKNQKLIFDTALESIYRFSERNTVNTEYIENRRFDDWSGLVDRITDITVNPVNNYNYLFNFGNSQDANVVISGITAATSNAVKMMYKGESINKIPYLGQTLVDNIFDSNDFFADRYSVDKYGYEFVGDLYNVNDKSTGYSINRIELASDFEKTVKTAGSGDGNQYVETTAYLYDEYEGGVEHNDFSFATNVPELSKVDALYRDNKGLLGKTNKLFREGKIGSLINRFHTNPTVHGDDFGGVAESSYDSVYGMSRGRNLKKKGLDLESNYTNPYCRVWTSHYQYSKMTNLIRPFTKGGEFASFEQIQDKYANYRPFSGSSRLDSFSSMNINGLPHITPYRGKNGNYENDVKRCMFSIENLAWKDIKFRAGIAGTDGLNVLSEEQIGPNGGRIMWFPPYNLKFNENVSTNWEGTSFIGRGEQIYTYNNTDRSGTLSFTVLVDHPSIVSRWAQGLGTDTKRGREEQLLRFFAGCGNGEPDDYLTDLKTKVTKNVETEYTITDLEWIPVEPELDEEEAPQSPTQIRCYVFFPNNLSGEDWMKEPNVVADYLYNGKTTYGTNSTYGYEASINNDLVFDEQRHVNTCITQESLKGTYGTWEYGIDKQTLNQKLRGGKPNYKDSKSYGLNSETFKTQMTSTNNEVDDEIKAKVKSIKELLGISEFSNDELENMLISFADLYKGELGERITADVLEKNDVKIVVNGYASSHGGNVSTNKIGDDNNRLSAKRARFVASYIKSMNIVDPDCIEVGVEKTLGVISDSVNELEPKVARSAEVIVTITPKEDMNPELDGENAVQKEIEYEEREVEHTFRITGTVEEEVDYVDNSGPGDEYLYFNYVDKEAPLVRKNLIEKVRYFDPAFHSITPEGFNARLTFLHQCTRQGPTVSSTDSTRGMAGNLAFGRPPVCVLRIGDFYNTRIIIDSLSIDYDTGGGVQWDMNPEGIGLQPMLANINIGFKFIGGSDISGPIERLQNAVSSNFFANTSVYDAKSDYRVAYDDGNVSSRSFAWQPSMVEGNDSKHIEFDSSK